jgi:hypothetical protein
VALAAVSVAEVAAVSLALVVAASLLEPEALALAAGCEVDSVAALVSEMVADEVAAALLWISEVDV